MCLRKADGSSRRRGEGDIMAKKNRKNKVTSDKSPKKPLNVKLLVAVILASVLSTVIYFGLTELSVILSEKAGRQIYIPVIEIYTILSGRSRGEIPTEADLPDEWSPERKTKFLESVPKRKKAVKILSLIVIALIVPIFCELASWWFELIKKGFSS